MSSFDENTEILGRSIQHPNPLFDYLSIFAPKKLKTLFKYCEYLYFNSPQVFAAMNKFAIYPVTNIIYHTENPTLKGKYKKVNDDIIKLKTILIKTGIDRHVYGNSFISMYFPFRRFMKCTRCGHIENIKHIKSLKFRIQKKRAIFTMRCSACGATDRAEVKDEKLRYAAGINVIRWDPKQIEIENNPITGESEFYYQIPEEIQQRIRKGDVHLLATMPMSFIECVAQNKLFNFAKNRVYHMKADAPAGVDNCWGFPGLAATLKQFFHVAVLRKANEAIAQEYVVPFRVIHPMQSTAQADPTITISLQNWVNETKLNLKAWRKDPLHLMFSPIPVGVTQLGGQGRALMVTGEITEAENSIIASMGIPREFLYGGLSATGSGVTLRMLENQLYNATSELIDEAQWIDDQIGTYMGWTKIKVGLEEFKLVDDVQQKMMLMNANASSGGVLFSNTSMAQMFGRNLETERKQRLQESLDEQRFQMDLQTRAQELQSNLAEQAKTQAAAGGSAPHYDQQQMVAQAQQIAMQLQQMPPGMKQSQLHQLQTEDVVMFALVSYVMEQLSQQQTQEAKAQTQAQMGAGGM